VKRYVVFFRIGDMIFADRRFGVARASRLLSPPLSREAGLAIELRIWRLTF
jgi:hypothetical protein